MKIHKVYTVTSKRLKKPAYFARRKVAEAVANQHLGGVDNCKIEEESVIVFDNIAQFDQLSPQFVKN